MAALTREDVERAVAILRRWIQRADGAGKTEAKRDAEHVQRVLESLYNGGRL